MKTSKSFKTIKEVYLLLIGIFLLSNLHAEGTSCCCGIDSEIEVPGGDFEFAPFPAPGGWIDGVSPGTIGPWDVSFGSVSHHDDGHNNLGAGNPNPSTAHMDLNGFSPGGLCQDINGFIIGAEYTLVFFYASHNGVPSSSAIVEIEGGDVLEENWTATNHGNVEWLQACYSFTATSTSMELCFLSEGGSSCCGMLIDDIEIFACFIDTELPIVTNIPLDIIIDCADDIPALEELDIMDNCDGDIEVDFVEDIQDDDSCLLSILRTWTIIDGCGNELILTQTIQAQDNTPPEILDSPLDLIIECISDFEDELEDWLDDLAYADIEDNCSDITLEVPDEVFDIEECGTYSVQLTYSDACDNLSFADASIIINDTDAPSFQVAPEDLVISCGDNKEDLIDDWLQDYGGAQIFEFCDYMVDNDYEELCESGQLVTFTAQDNCGNTSSIDAMIMISLDTLIFQIDTFTCDQSHPLVVEEFHEAVDGCDTLTIYQFDILPLDTVVIDSIICVNSQSYYDTLMSTNLYGCDSMTVYYFQAIKPDTTWIIDMTCEVNQVTNDTVYLQNVYGCDSIIYEQIVFTENDTIYAYAYICELDSIQEEISLIPGTVCDTVLVSVSVPLFSDSIYIEQYSCAALDTGLFVMEGINASGCDSLTFVHVLYDPIDPILINEYTCIPDNVGLDTVINTSGICDSIVITQIQFAASDTQYVEELVCEVDLENDTLFYTNAMGCDSLIIYAYTPEQIQFDYLLDFDPCVSMSEAQFEFIDIQGGIAPYTFSLDGINFSNNPVFDSLGPGEYQLLVNDSQGCISDSVMVIIESIADVVVNISSEIKVTESEPFQFEFSIIGEYQSFYWSDPTVLSCIDCFDPIVTTDASILLFLFVEDQYGCVIEEKINIQVMQIEEDPPGGSIQIPNIFSPNGDGVNDEFLIYNYSDSDILSFVIYNRWGDKIYQIENPSQTTISWDGRFGGKALDPDVFIFYLEYKETNGSLKRIAGDISLVK